MGSLTDPAVHPGGCVSPINRKGNKMKVLFGFIFLALSSFLVIFQMALFQNPPPYFIQHSKLFIIVTVISLFCASLVYAGADTKRIVKTIAGSIALIVCLVLLIFLVHNAVTGIKQIISYGHIVLIGYAILFGYYGFRGVTSR